MNPTRIMVVDDHTIVRQGLVALLGGQPDLTLVAEAGTAAEALERAAACAPDVVILDLTLPDRDGTEVIRELAQRLPATRVVVLTMHAEAEYVRAALRAGAAGYLVKGADVADLLEAVRGTVRGEVFLSPTIARAAIDAGRAAATAELTAREQEILRLVALGNTSRDVAQTLGISPKTVENHRQNVMRKLGIHDVAGLTRFAIRAGLIAPA